MMILQVCFYCWRQSDFREVGVDAVGVVYKGGMEVEDAVHLISGEGVMEPDVSKVAALLLRCQLMLHILNQHLWQLFVIAGVQLLKDGVQLIHSSVISDIIRQYPHSILRGIQSMLQAQRADSIQAVGSEHLVHRLRDSQRIKGAGEA